MSLASLFRNNCSPKAEKCINKLKYKGKINLFQIINLAKGKINLLQLRCKLVLERRFRAGPSCSWCSDMPHH